VASRKCLMCGGVVEVGFEVDRGHGDWARRREWYEGVPRRSIWRGLKLPKRRIPIETFRCTKCGFLMEFANPPQEPF